MPGLCSGTIFITKSVSVFSFYQPHFLRLLADSSLSESLGGFGSHNGLCCSGEGLKLGLSNSSILKSDCNNIQLSFGQFHSASFCFIAPFFHTCQGRAAVQRRYTGSYNLARVLMLVALQTFMSLSRSCFAKKHDYLILACPLIGHQNALWRRNCDDKGGAGRLICSDFLRGKAFQQRV